MNRHAASQQANREMTVLASQMEECARLYWSVPEQAHVRERRRQHRCLHLRMTGSFQPWKKGDIAMNSCVVVYAMSIRVAG